jgi:hypothetical protein
MGVDGMRWFRRALFEHRRLPRRVRILRVIQAGSAAAAFGCTLISVGFRLGPHVFNLLLLAPVLVLLASIFCVGLLTWSNYERTAEIWAENIRGRGLESAGLGWLVDTGTIRGLGAGKSIFVTLMAIGIVVQIVWPYFASR